MAYEPLIGQARLAKRMRKEMQCDPQWVLDLAAEREQLRAENVRLAERYSEAGVREDALRAERDQARQTAEHWKAEHLAGNAVIDQLRAEVEALRKDAALEQAIRRAACELPEGWEISVRVEKDGGGIELIDPYGTIVDFPTNGERLALEVSDAIGAAMAAKGGV